jgi:FAD/FMN-containing dehydrogenase
MQIKLQDCANITGKGRVRAAYGRNYELLAAIKNKYNPNNLFRNQNINPKLKNI